MNIVIFGGLGETAAPIIDLLVSENYNVTVFDISSNNPYSGIKNIKFVYGDICNYEDVQKALFGVGIVIHLAVNISDIHNNKLTFQTNVFGTYNILQNALISKIPKILIASSASVHNKNKLVTLNNVDPATDYLCSAGEDFTYDLTKHIQEIIAKDFSQTYEMNCLVLRLGHIVDGKKQTTLSGDPLSQLTYCKGGWVCRFDVARAFLKAIETDFTGYHMVNIIGSYQADAFFRKSAASDLLSFECDEKFYDY